MGDAIHRLELGSVTTSEQSYQSIELSSVDRGSVRTNTNKLQINGKNWEWWLGLEF
jgi:hypothetical protein